MNKWQKLYAYLRKNRYTYTEAAIELVNAIMENKIDEVTTEFVNSTDFFDDPA